MALNVSGKKSRLNFAEAVNEGIRQQPSRQSIAEEAPEIAESPATVPEHKTTAELLDIAEKYQSESNTSEIRKTLTEKPAEESKPKKEKSKFKKLNFDELVTKYRVKGKVKNVQKTLYISEEVADYIQTYVKEEGEPFGKIVEMLLRKAINE